MSRFLIFFTFGTLAFGSSVKNSFIPDQDTGESLPVAVVSKPSTFRAAIQAEINRLKSLQDVFPPQNQTFYTPYGERTIIALKFPKPPKYDPNSYGPPPQTQYGTPQKDSYAYVPLESQSQEPGDIGVITSQNYHYRQNIRFRSSSDDPRSNLNHTRPSNELVIELAKAFAERHGKDPFTKDPESKSQSSFVIVAIESRFKTNPNFGKFGFVGGDSWTNGTIIFPAPKSPQILTNIPFALRSKEDLEHIFDGYDIDSHLGLIPKDKLEIKSFIKLLHQVHTRKHYEGKETIYNLMDFESTLSRPRLPGAEGFLPEDSPQDIELENQARLNNWLYTSSVGQRKISSNAPVFVDVHKTYLSYETLPKLLLPVQNKFYTVV